MKTRDGLTLCACASLCFAAVAGTAQDANTGVSDAEGRLIPGRTFAERDLFADTWDAIDELGRTLGTSETVGAPRAKKVGIFYWTWHEGGMIAQEPYNNERILKAHPEAAADGADPAWGPMGPHHHWGEPLFGYYTTTDPWVSRRHALMLAEAGIDAVVFDSTNGSFTWMDSAWTLMRTWSELRRQGVRTPQFAYMLPFGEQPCMLTSILQLYRDVYRPGKFSDLWFRWRGKPLIHAHPALVRPVQHMAERLHPAELLRDIRVVHDIVAEIRVRRGIERREPQCRHIQRLQIVELFIYAQQIADAVPVAVLEAARPDLIDHRVLIPSCTFHSLFLPYPSITCSAAISGVRMRF